MRPKINNLEFYKLNGKVKQIKTLEYDAVQRNGAFVPGKMRKSVNAHDLVNFSEDGLCIENIHFAPDGTYGKTDYENGIAQQTITYDKDGIISDHSKNKYNSTGQYELIVHQDHIKKFIYNSFYKYNEKDELIEYTSTQNDRIINRMLMHYDDRGNEIEKIMHRDNDAYYGKIENIYNEVNIKSEEKQYDKDNKLKEHQIYKYNKNGEMIGVTTNGIYRHFGEYKDTNKYEYDHHQNWIKKIELYKDTVERIHLREITYYDEKSSDKTLTIHDNIYDMAKQNNPIPPAKYTNELDVNQWKWISEGSDDGEFFSVERFYTQTFGFIPSSTTIFSYQIELWALKNYLISEFGAVEIYALSDNGFSYWDEQLHICIISFPRNKYVLKMDHIQQIGSSQYEYDEPENEVIRKFGNYIQTGNLSIYFPAKVFGNRDEAFENELCNIIGSFRVKKVAEKPEISMVATIGNLFVLKAYPVKDDFVINDLDLNYGNGFEKFHNQLMERFQKEGKGLVLFHGEPGTGKTYYIRHLLRKMADIKKIVIYMPPNMVDHLVDPSFMTFISAKVAEYSASGRSCVLLIEDAEPLLVARDANIRVQGITNLLNMTDGLLNDMLNLQIICTFNVNIKQLDKALLRPGRLTARKEFKALPDFEANILGHQLGIKHIFNAPATLSEIYSHVVDKQTITHTG